MKLVVVDRNGTKITFTKEKLGAYHDKDGYLIVNDQSEESPRKIAAFKDWVCWFYES